MEFINSKYKKKNYCRLFKKFTNWSFDELHGTDKVVVDTMTLYLSQKFVPDQPGAINILESAVKKFKLNTEQELAFKILPIMQLLIILSSKYI